MGLSRNKVAVSEGAAGSPPFYGESALTNTMLVAKRESDVFWVRCSILKDLLKRGVLETNEMSFGVHEEKIAKSRITFGGVAQLGEHLPCKQGVMGSNPIISTKRSFKNQVHNGS